MICSAQALVDGSACAQGGADTNSDEHASLWLWALKPACGAFRARRVLVEPGDHWDAKSLGAEIGAEPCEVLDVVALRGVESDGEGDEGEPALRRTTLRRRFALRARWHYGVVFRSLPLVRFSAELRPSGGSSSSQPPRPRLEIGAEAVKLLSRLSAPIRLVAFVGPGRCGKSSTLSRLAEDDFDVFASMSGRCGDASAASSCAAVPRASNGAAKHGDGEKLGKLSRQVSSSERGQAHEFNKFPVGHDAAPITDGIDFAAVPHPTPGEGTVVFLDCEGSDNPCTENASHYRMMMALLLSLPCHVVLCQFGGCSETTLEEIAAALAAKDLILDEASGRLAHRTSLCLLVIACRFKSLSDVFLERQVLADKDGQAARNEVRGLIRRAFPERRLRTLPHLADREAYDEALRALKSDIHKSTHPVCADGLPLDGAQLCDVLQSLAEQLERTGHVEPAGVMTRVVQERIAQAAARAEANFEEEFVRPMREALDDGYIDRIEERLRAGAQHALVDFDAATARVASELRLRARTQLDHALLAVTHGDLRWRNDQLRAGEEAAAERSVRECTAAFEADPAVPKRPLTTVPQSSALLAAELLAGDGEEGLLARHSTGLGASLRCAQVAVASRAQLRAALQHALGQLRLEADALRQARTADLEQAASGAQARFEEALREAVPAHYVEEQALEAFGADGAHRAEALAAFDAEVEALWGAWGPWEREVAAAKRAHLSERLEVVFHRAAARNRRIRSEAGRKCDALVAQLSETLAASLPAAPGRCWDDRELAAREVASTAELEAAFSRDVAKLQQDDGFLYGDSVVEEARSALRLHCLGLWKELLRQNALLQEGVRAEVDVVRGEALAACEAQLPEVDGYVDGGRLATLFEPARASAFAHFGASALVAQLEEQHGTWGVALREQANGALAAALHRHLDELQEQAEAFRREEARHAEGLVARHAEAFEQAHLPELPLRRPLSDDELQEIEEALARAEGAVGVEVEAAGFRCAEVAAEALRQFSGRLGPLVRGVREGSLRKRRLAARVQAAVASARADFEGVLRPHLHPESHALEAYVDEAAWLREGTLGSARAAAEAALAAACARALQEESPSDDLDAALCADERTILDVSLSRRLDALAEQNAELKQQEREAAEAAAEKAFASFAAASVRMPLRRVLPECVFADLLREQERCRSRFAEAAAGLRCGEVLGAAAAALEARLAGALAELRGASAELAERRGAAMARAAQTTVERFGAMCDEAWQRVGSSSAAAERERQQLSKKREVLSASFDDDARSILGDGVLVERGPWEEDLLAETRGTVLRALDDAYGDFGARCARLRRTSWARVVAPCFAVLAAFALLLGAVRVFLVTSHAERAMRPSVGGAAADAPATSQSARAASSEALRRESDVEEVAAAAAVSGGGAPSPADVGGGHCKAGEAADVRGRGPRRPEAGAAAAEGGGGEHDHSESVREASTPPPTADVASTPLPAENAAATSPGPEPENDSELCAVVASAPLLAEEDDAELPTASAVIASAPLLAEDDAELPAAIASAPPLPENGSELPIAGAVAASTDSAPLLVENLAGEAEESSMAEACADANEFCREWAEQGHCVTRPAFMLKRCRASCGTCGGQAARQCSLGACAGWAGPGPPAAPPGPEAHSGRRSCEDQLEFCADWASQGLCAKNAAFMLSRCARSCDACAE